MNAQIDLGEMYIAVSPYKGKNPALLVNFKGETEIYKVATFKDKATADWFVECVKEAMQGHKQVSGNTNYDKIRSWSVEKMAKWMHAMLKIICSYTLGLRVDDSFEEKALEWLKMEAEE